MQEKSEKLNLGLHCSISGGLHHAIDAALDLSIDTFQIFTKNQRQWREKVISPEEQKIFQEKKDAALIGTTFSHTSYLINLGSTNEEIRTNSILALSAEIIRCHQLGLKFTVLHPRSNSILTHEEKLEKIADGLVRVLDHTAEYSAGIALENTAGQGSVAGGKLEDLQYLIQKVKSDRLGVCIDTCHAFAAGYDIRTAVGVEEMLAKIDGFFGIEKIRAFHLNDSKGALGSRLDRHEHIGKGQLGLQPFRYLMRHFKHVPKVLETDKDDDMDRINIALLRDLA